MSAARCAHLRQRCGLEVVDLLFQSVNASGFFGYCKNHSIESLHIIRELYLGSRHGIDQSIIYRDPPAVSGGRFNSPQGFYPTILGGLISVDRTYASPEGRYFDLLIGFKSIAYVMRYSDFPIEVFPADDLGRRRDRSDEEGPDRRGEPAGFSSRLGGGTAWRREYRSGHLSVRHPPVSYRFRWRRRRHLRR